MFRGAALVAGDAFADPDVRLADNPHPPVIPARRALAGGHQDLLDVVHDAAVTGTRSPSMSHSKTGPAHPGAFTLSSIKTKPAMRTGQAT